MLADGFNNLGNVLLESGRAAEAIAAFSRSIALRPNHADAHNNLGTALMRERGNLAEAAACYSKAVSLNPTHAAAHGNLGNALTEMGNLDGAIAALRAAITLDPRQAGAYHNLGLALRDAGLLDQALACFDQAIALSPADAAIASSRLYAMHFHPAFDPAALYAAHRQWNARHAEPLTRLIQPHRNVLDPDRPLRIGYVSADFRMHPVGRFIEPLLRRRMAGQQVFCYADVRIPDGLTERLKSHADVWRNSVGMSDEALAHRIRQDGIDILVDLTLHAANGRLGVFARKPAPVQVTYLGYCSTTGLDAMDYRITDAYLDPPLAEIGPYSEQSAYLPITYWCYAPGMATPEVGPLPALRNGHITFGCLNTFAKVSGDALSAFGRILAATPGSRLILHAKEGSHRQRIFDLYARQGIEPHRVSFVGYLPMADYFRLYGQIDIALDPFPCAGGTTTCDGLWMGVPVITLAGKTAVGRAGVSILSNVGFPEMIARSIEEYVNLATNLAFDVARLSHIRVTLRDRMSQSALMDATRFAEALAGVYRKLWEKWCRGT